MAMEYTWAPGKLRKSGMLRDDRPSSNFGYQRVAPCTVPRVGRGVFTVQLSHLRKQRHVPVVHIVGFLGHVLLLFYKTMERMAA
jgi:hypothetical protein